MWYYAAGEDERAWKLSASIGKELVFGGIPTLPEQVQWRSDAVFLFSAHPRFENRKAVLLEHIEGRIITRGSCPPPEEVRPLSHFFFLNLAEKLLTRANQHEGDRENLARLIRSAVLRNDAVLRADRCRRTITLRRFHWREGIEVTVSVAPYIREGPDEYCRTRGLERWSFTRDIALPPRLAITEGQLCRCGEPLLPTLPSHSE